MELKLSVIIPIYNAERFLPQCLDSLREQSLRDIEILCVDDGSTDSSAGIVDEYAAKDRRIVPMHQQNLGAGAARNAGIEAAKGKYLFFMDADDFVTPDGLGRAYALAEEKSADLLRFRAHDFNQRSGERSDSPHNALRLIPGLFFGKVLDFRHTFFLFPRMCAAPWGGIIRRDFVLEEGLRFNTFRVVNDRSFYWESIFAAKRIVLGDFFVLNYRTQLDTSLVGSRIRYFDCHFGSYELIYRASARLPAIMRRCVLNGELLDMANWLEQGVKTERAGEIYAMCEDFLQHMDKSPWGGKTENTKWYRRMKACAR